MITEEKVKRAVESFMDKKGFKKVDGREMHEHGPDLSFRNRGGGTFYHIEAKGETGAKNEMETKPIRGLGQLLKDYIRHKNHYCGLAVPASWERRVLKKVSRDAMKALNLVIFLVEESGRVREVRTRDRKP